MFGRKFESWKLGALILAAALVYILLAQYLNLWPFSGPAATRAYSSHEFGFEFRYPSSWGNIQTKTEPCNLESGPSGNLQYQYFEQDSEGRPCKHILFSNGRSELFMGARTKNYFSALGRGGYFGDFFLNAPCNADELFKLAAVNCQEKINPKGIRYLETVGNSGLDGQYHDYFYIQNADRAEIVLSDERLENKSGIDEVLASFKFIQ